MNKWDKRFLGMAHREVKEWSKDPSTKVAAIIIDSDNNVRAVSYNGFPKGIKDDERLNNRELKYSLVQHAESNSISTCAKLGIKTDGCSIAITNFPCSTCMGLLINAGIKKVITSKPTEDYLSRWKESIDLSKELMEEAGIELVMIDS